MPNPSNIRANWWRWTIQSGILFCVMVVIPGNLGIAGYSGLILNQFASSCRRYTIYSDCQWNCIKLEILLAWSVRKPDRFEFRARICAEPIPQPCYCLSIWISGVWRHPKYQPLEDKIGFLQSLISIVTFLVCRTVRFVLAKVEGGWSRAWSRVSLSKSDLNILTRLLLRYSFPGVISTYNLISYGT
jgi:hypothetical protein